MIEEMGGDFLQWLRGFYYVAKTGSVTLAAHEMGRNQPTVSHQVKCLENEFGVIFFDRSGGKMTLTPEGRIFLEKTISLFEIIKEMKSEIANERLPHKGEIIIATTHAISCYYLPRFIVDFHNEYPNVKIKVEGGGLEMIKENLETDEADFGIAIFDDIPEILDYYEIFQTGLRLITAKKDPVFNSQKVTLEQIANIPFILFPRTSSITPLIEKRFAENNLELNVVMTLNNYEDVKRYVGLGVGVAILDEYALNEEDEKKLNIFPVDQFFGERRCGLIMRKRKYLSPPVKEILRYIKPDINIK